MKCTLMHRRVEVAKLELDDETGIIQKIESVMSAEHLPVGVPVKNGIADRHELNKWWAPFWCARGIGSIESDRYQSTAYQMFWTQSFRSILDLPGRNRADLGEDKLF